MQSISELQCEFEARLPEIERLVGSHFCHLDPEARQEAVQNATVLAWRYFLNTAKQGKHGREDVFKSIVWWSVQHTMQGRQGAGSSKAKCVLDYARRSSKGVKIDRTDLDLHASLKSPVPTQAAFRVDTPIWLDSLGKRNRAIAVDLANGYSTSEVSRSHSISPGRVSQLRREFERSYRDYHGAA